ncbi:MAG: CAP domain-containing protein [Acidimicrobiia bacterium]
MAQAIKQRTRVFGVLAAVLVAALALGACSPAAEDQDYAMVNALRGSYGLGGLGRSGELDAKARAQADRMAKRGTIYHSTNLAAGVSPGWRLIGENVAVAGSIEQAQSALEASPGHLANMVNGEFTEVGIGVTASNGRVYVVQVFVGR